VSKIGVAAIAKNEAPYVLEWVAHYTLLGFDSIIIADHESTDGTDQLLELLDNRGLITTAKAATMEGDFPSPYVFGSTPQGRFYNSMIESSKGTLDYLCLFDMDEFLFGEDSNAPVRIINEVFSQPEVGGIAINWALFGSSGHVKQGHELMTERFTSHLPADNNVNHHYKSIVRPELCSGMRNPHFPTLLDRTLVLSSGQPVEHFNGKAGLSDVVQWAPLRLHHYFSKSEEEYIKKMNRGMADSKDYRDMDEFYLYNSNCVDGQFDVRGHSADIKRLIQEWELPT
jgi:glycosyltransferase involved in cell wall biosynthesis